MTRGQPLRVVIADDEALARRRLTRLLSAMADVEIVAECSDGLQVIATIEEEPVDVLLLDIQMPGLSGLETSALVGEGGPRVVLVTAHPEHATAAFDLGVTDYVLKPVEAGRLRRSLERARQAVQGPVCDSHQPSAASLDRLPVATSAGVRLIDPELITHADFDGSLVTVHTTTESILTDFNLAELENRLPGSGFERVHRRAIVNLAHVALLEPVATGGYVARTTTGRTVIVSRQAARRLRRRLGMV